MNPFLYVFDQVSYAYFTAFLSLLSNMELIKKVYIQYILNKFGDAELQILNYSFQKVYLNATNGSRSLEITKEEFLYSAQMMSQITPLEIDVLFVLCDLLHQVPIFH